MVGITQGGGGSQGLLVLQPALRAALKGIIEVSHQFPKWNQARNHCHQKVSFCLVLVVFPWFWLSAVCPRPVLSPGHTPLPGLLLQIHRAVERDAM